ncbi:DNA modification methylase [Methylopila sp. 73B]|uniref:DNA modification methylase n=1 Tax=Methylopila sp. 73B TaxID=1120792 RepID=UPI00037262DD|nr:DNA modification methylase [Methylopila sp. 73B]
MARKTQGSDAAPGTVREALLAKDVARRADVKAVSRASAAEARPRNDLLPQLALVDRDPSALRAPKRNVRMIEPGHVRDVANSITVLGFTAPVIIDKAGVIMDGAVRVEAAKALGLPTIPCVVADHLSAAERKLLRVAVNRLQEKGRWDLEELRLELEELIIDESPIEVSGFESFEIDAILADPTPDATEVGPLAPTADAKPVVRVGDVYLLGDHRVICGDARDKAVLSALMAGARARFVFTDQPYNVKISGHVTGGDHREFAMASGEMSDVQFGEFNEQWIAAVTEYLLDGGVLGTYIDWRGLSSVSAAAAQIGLSQLNLIVWAKTNAGMGSLYRSQHELLPLFKKGDAPHKNNIDLGRKGRWRSNLWTYPGASTVGSEAQRGLQHHPTVKPVVMLEEALLDLTDRGEIVIDPFLGSGSTLIAAEQTGRICRGVEIDPLYVAVILERYQTLTGRRAVLEQTGQSFAEVVQQRTAETASA